ncbi:MAG: elongation factor P [Chloroflexi bacterium]|nr:elongation factor P [Chloroflexota bacterium]
MIDVNDLRRGSAFELDGDLFKVLEYSHNKPGRGNATIRVKIVNLRSGAQFERTFQSGARVQDVELELAPVQYLYHDGDFYNFMNTNTFEQIALSEQMLGERVSFLRENMELQLVSFENEPIDIDLPPNVELKVTDSPMAIAGDTAAGGGTKIVTMETGLKVTAPLFINVNDTLRIDTRTGQYITRV